MGFNTNTTNRLPAITPIGTTYVFDISILPAPVSTVITLPPVDSNYIIADTVDFAGNSLKFDAPGKDLSIQTLDDRISKITSSTTGTFLDVVNAANVTLKDLDITLSGTGATGYNILGVTGAVSFISVRTAYTGGGTKTIGIIGTGDVLLEAFVNTGFTNGITFQNVSAISWSNFFMLSDFTGTGAFVTIDQVNVLFQIRGGGMVGASGQSLFNIDPTINPANPSFISNVLNNGASANYFTPGVQFTISNIVDNSSPSDPVTQVNNIGGLAQYETLIAHGYVVGERIFHTSFATAGYLGSKVVTAVDSTTLYKTGDSFVIDETGDSIAPKALITATGHTYTLDEPILITETINFNAGYLVKDPLTNTFDIELTELFPGIETAGIVASGSLTEKDSRVIARDNGAQKDSLTAGGWTTTGNTNATTVADGTYGDIDFTGALALSVNEGITLFDSPSGAIRKDRPNPQIVAVSIEFNVSPTGGATRTYQIKAVISTDGGSSFVDLPDIIETKEQYSGSADERPFQTIREILMNEGDIVKFQVEGVGTTSGFTADQGCTQVRA